MPKKIKPLKIDEAKKLFTTDAIKNLSQSEWGEIKNKWPYHDHDGNIIGIEIEFSAGNTEFFIFDGESVIINSSVSYLYNLHEAANSEKPRLIVSSPAEVDALKKLEQFTVCSYRGNIEEVRWRYFGKSTTPVFVYMPDCDKGYNDAISLRIIIDLRTCINKKDIHVVKPVPVARVQKPEGATMLDVLEIFTVNDVFEYIDFLDNRHEFSDIEPGSPVPAENPQAEDRPSSAQKKPKESGSISENSMPFKILGVGDDGKAAFITQAGRLVKYNMESLNESKFKVLANHWWWWNNYAYNGKLGKPQWETVCDDLLRLAEQKDFIEDNIRGRGAWRDGDKISYHDGINTHGEWDEEKIYLRLPYRKIGITDDPASPELCKKIKEIVFKLSFETPADAVRALAWSVLAPFAGALKFRPAILMTGPSGTGKSTISDLVISKIALPRRINGNESSAAFIYQSNKKDSGAIVIDESEGDSEKGRKYRNDQLSLMRANFTDDAPDSGKGGADGNPITYKMKTMFMFIGIDPTLEKVADENRIFRINISPPKNGDDWENIENKLMSLLSDENCRKVRALTWQKLKIIIELTKRVVKIIRKITKRDYRSSYADAMLCAAFMVVWTGNDNPDNEQIKTTLDKYYEYQPVEDHRDESEEFLEKIFQEVIEIIHSDGREKLTIIECMNRICTNGHINGETDNKDDKNVGRYISQDWIDDYRMELSRKGLKVERNYDLAVRSEMIWIMRVTGTGPGYIRILRRHKGYKEYRTVYYYTGERKKSIILRGVLIRNGEGLEEIPF